MNVFDLAMQMELDSKDHYEKMRDMTPVTGLKKIFAVLADSEITHYHVFKSIKAEKSLELAAFPDLSTDLEQTKNTFTALQINDELLGKMKTTQDGLLHAMNVEKDTISLYEDIVKTHQQHVCNSEVVPVLMKIVEEEKKHFDLLQNIHQIIDKFENFKVIHKFGKHAEI